MSQDRNRLVQERLKKEAALLKLRELQRVALNDKFRLFVPNPGFQADILEANERILLAIAGNQSGKTTIGAAWAGENALMRSVDKNRKPRFNRKTHSFIVSGQGMKTGIENTIIPKLKQVMGENDFKIKNNSNGSPSEILWSTGSVTKLLTQEQDDMVFEGATYDWGWIDEPVRRGIFVGLVRGLMAKRGPLLMTGTPIAEPWIYNELYLPGVTGKNKNVRVFEGTVYENKAISKESIEEFISSLTQDEIEVRLHGKFSALQGRVIKEFDHNRHIIKPFDIPFDWPIWLSIDPHRGKPHAVLWLAVGPDNKKYICNELFLPTTIRALAQKIININKEYPNVVDCLIDTSAQEDGWERISARSVMEDEGLYTSLAQKKNKKTSGILLINDEFKRDNLFVFNTCTRTIKELEMYTYKRNRDNIFIDEPRKEWDEMMDNLRYILTENPTHITGDGFYDTIPYYRNKK